ncbi:hypothetical protein [Streptomyces turgidiscabies]|uniref:hypothetical protein n=1 Tax=Streptomyces turgidiscabies TaxID=85558 RepID=UPI0038F6F38F
MTEMKRPGKWAMFADGEIHELTAVRVKEIHGGTASQLGRCLLMYARNHGLKFSQSMAGGGGIRFRLWQVSEVDAYLPPDVVEKESRVSGYRCHMDCTHPKTSWYRQKCRDQRRL